VRIRPICSVDGCGKPHRGNGFCNAHNIRLKRHGSPTGGEERRGRGLEFLTKLIGAPPTEECIPWPMSRRADGRGQIRYKGRQAIASRVCCELAHGPPPHEKMEAAHTCGKGHLGCVNPGHLRWKTMLENERDKIEHGTISIGPKHGHAKLSEHDASIIYSEMNDTPTREIAERFGISERTARRAKAGTIWPALQRERANVQAWR